MRGNPRPTIIWFKDDQPIEFDERTQQVEHGDGVCELIINKPTPKDSGQFSCTATNNLGTKKVEHLVDFQPPPSMPGSRRDSGMPPTKKDSLAGAESGAETAKEDANESNKNSRAGSKARGRSAAPPAPKEEEAEPEYSGRRHVAPTQEELLQAARSKLSFVTHLTNRVFPEGSKIKLTCVAQGPEPNARWLKNDQPIVLNARVRNLSQDGFCVLEINNCTVDDSGTYTLFVRNTECAINCSCTLQVYEAISTADLLPTFTRSLKGMCMGNEA